MTTVLAAGDHFVLPRLLRDAVLDQVPDADVRELLLPWPHEPFHAVAEVDEASGSEDEIIEALDGVVVCVTQMAPITERVLSSSPALKLVCVGRGGPVNVNVEAARQRGVAVTYAPGRNAVATAEHTVALMLAAARRVPSTHADLAGGTWRGDYYDYEQVGPELSGSTVGVIGLGAIGRRVAAILSGFGARVVAHDPYADQAAAGDVELVGLEELMKTSSFVTVHARATPDTAGMVSRKLIETLPPGAVLVNCARGSLVDYDAVCDALDEGQLFGAAFDVFPEEPIPEGSRLLTTPNLVTTPHLAGASKQTAANAARMTAGEVARYVRGEAPEHSA